VTVIPSLSVSEMDLRIVIAKVAYTVCREVAKYSAIEDTDQPSA